MTAIGPITLNRECEVVQIPSGARGTLPAGTPVRIMQSLSGSYTVSTDLGYMCRIDGKDADALGLSNAEASKPAPEGIFSEQMVWDQLKTVYDPEIPVNIVDLGLIYSCVVASRDEGGNKIHVKMSMTAPGCGMGPTIAADAQSRIMTIEDMDDASVELVWDPPWNQSMISEEGKMKLGMV